MTSYPFKPLLKTAIVTAPLIGAAMVTPLFIVSKLELPYFWIMLLAVSMLTGMSWALQLFLLRFRERFGKIPWIPILISSGFMIACSLAIFHLIDAPIPAWADRLPMVRYVNVLVVNTIIYIIIHLRLLTETKSKLVAENAQLKFANLEKQHKLLKEQINPHFLFNALGTAKSLLRRDPSLAENYIIRLADFLRASLTEAPDVVTLKEELKLVRDFVELQKIRFRDALDFQCDVPAETLDAQIPFFSLLTLVENAIKHNAMNTEEPLKISIHQTGNWIEVRNNLRPKPIAEPGQNSGLRNLQERCLLMGHGELKIDKTEESFAVIIQLLPSKRV